MRSTKVRILVAFLVVLTFAVAWSQGGFTALNKGLPVDAGRIDGAVSMKDGKGAFYLVYLKSGSLCASASADGGDTYAPYSMELGHHALTNFRQLTLLTRLVPESFAFFVADEEGRAGLFSLHARAEGGLELFTNGPLDDASGGSVTGYTVLPESPTRIVLFYLKSGSLRVATIDMTGYAPALWSGPVSTLSQKVTLFDVRQRFTAGHDSFTGAYLSVSDDGIGELCAFTLMDDRTVSQTTLADAPVTGKQAIDVIVTIGDNAHVTWINGQAIGTYQDSDGIWRAGAAGSFPSEGIASFAITDAREYLPAVATFPHGSIFVGDRNTGMFGPPLEGYPVLRAPGGIVSPRRHLYLLGYLADVAGTREVLLRTFDFASGTWTSLAFPTIPDATIQDAWFSGTTAAIFAAVLYARGDGMHVEVFQADPATPSYLEVTDVALGDSPPDATPAGALGGELLGTDVLVLTAPGATVVVNAASGEAEVVPPSVTFSAVFSPWAEPPRRYLKATDQGTFLFRAGP